MREQPEFPGSALPALDVWREVVKEVHAANPPSITDKPALDGRGEPVGPRQWSDNGPKAWKVFMVRFLPGPDGQPVNHHLSVEFEARDGRPRIRAGSHLGDYIEIVRRRSMRYSLSAFRDDLRSAARCVGLLPAEPSQNLQREIANAYVAGRNAQSLGLPWEHTV
jgi:hypothetical protein